MDVRDGSISIFGWFHLNKPKNDVFFVLGNLKIKVNDTEYTGLAIKIVDGLIMTADGRMIRHGTTASDYDGSIFGMQFAANSISMGSKLEEDI